MRRCTNRRSCTCNEKVHKPGIMSPEDAEMSRNDTTTGAGFFAVFNTTLENVPLNVTEVASEVTDPLPIIISLVCIFLLLATCLIFVTLCKPSALDQSLYGPHECMPYHQDDATEPQLRLWKRLGSLRRSINSFRRNRPISQHQRTCPRRPPTIQDWSFTESTKM
ncbi:uncharacterized protein C10orf105 homolog [Discoglossus pictus]